MYVGLVTGIFDYTKNNKSKNQKYLKIKPKKFEGLLSCFFNC